MPILVPILATKLNAPFQRPGHVPRPRLIERLNLGLGGRKKGFAATLTLISAPAGFGKTTLASEWLNALAGDGVVPPVSNATLRQGHAIATSWLSLGEADNDPTHFLAYVVFALQRVEPSLGRAALNMLLAPQFSPVEVVLVSVINDLSASAQRIVLVLDDYHVIEAQPIHDAVSFLIEHSPPHFHLVILTRDDPPLSMARLRARGQLTEVRAMDLAFSLSEAAVFLNQAMRLGLSPDDVAAIFDRTEGWIAGLQLAAASLQGRPDVSQRIETFTGSHRFVLDYLVEEVVEQQPERVRSFLMRTAILDRLNAWCEMHRS